MVVALLVVALLVVNSMRIVAQWTAMYHILHNFAQDTVGSVLVKNRCRRSRLQRSIDSNCSEKVPRLPAHFASHVAEIALCCEVVGA